MPFGGPERAGDGEPSDPPGPLTPPTAADFWSEEAVALHDAFQAPVGAVPESDRRHDERQIRRDKRFRAIRRWRRRASYSSAERRTRDRVVPEPSAATRRVRLAGIRSTPWRLASVLGTLVLLAALLVVSLPRSSAPLVASRPTQTATSDLTMFGPLMSRTEQDLSSVQRVALHRWPRMPSANRPVKRPPHHQTDVTPQPASTVSEGLPAATSTSVPATPVAANSTSSSAYSASAASAPPSQPASSPPSQPASSPPTPAVSAGANSSTTESSSPSSQPAFGADGTLGPGHSSNG